jgi:hypothetical protein
MEVFMKNMRYIAILLSLLTALPINGTESDNQHTKGSFGTAKSYSLALLKALGQCGKSTICTIHKLIGYIEDHPVLVCAAATSIFILYINTIIKAYRTYLGVFYNLFNQYPVEKNFFESSL